MFPDERAKLRAGRISNAEREDILTVLGVMAQGKYSELVVSNGSAKGQDLSRMKDALQFKPNVPAFENLYWLEGDTEHWTNVINYFEYGTGLYNTRTKGERKPIRPVEEEYMKFIAKDGKFVRTKKVKGVHAVHALEATKAWMRDNRSRLQRQIRLEFQNE